MVTATTLLLTPTNDRTPTLRLAVPLTRPPSSLSTTKPVTRVPDLATTVSPDSEIVFEDRVERRAVAQPCGGQFSGRANRDEGPDRKRQFPRLELLDLLSKFGDRFGLLRAFRLLLLDEFPRFSVVSRDLITRSVSLALRRSRGPRRRRDGRLPCRGRGLRGGSRGGLRGCTSSRRSGLSNWRGSRFSGLVGLSIGQLLLCLGQLLLELGEALIGRWKSASCTPQRSRPPERESSCGTGGAS